MMNEKKGCGCTGKVAKEAKPDQEHVCDTEKKDMPQKQMNEKEGKSCGCAKK